MNEKNYEVTAAVWKHGKLNICIKTEHHWLMRVGGVNLYIDGKACAYLTADGQDKIDYTQRFVGKDVNHPFYNFDFVVPKELENKRDSNATVHFEVWTKEYDEIEKKGVENTTWDKYKEEMTVEKQ